MMKKLLIIGLILLFVAPAQAEIRWQKFSFFKNSGGLADGFAPTAIENNQAADIQNIVLTTSGAFKTRDGFAKLNSSTLGAAVICTGLTFYKQADGTKFLVGVFDDDKIRKMDYDGGGDPDGTWDDITGSLSFSVGGTDLASFTVGEDILIIDDGLNSTAPYKFTGTGNAADLSGTPPSATMVAFHKTMAFAAGDTSNPSTLSFSDLGDIENWTTGLSGSVNVETNDGSIIRSIIAGFDALYIFKDRSIWRLGGSDKDTFVLQRMISGIGCKSRNGVAKLGNRFIFTDGQGDTYEYDGAVGLKRISERIRGTIDASNKARYEFVSSIFFQTDYYTSISTTGSSTHDRVLVWDSFNDAWTKFKGLNANAMAVAEDSAGQDILIFGDYGGFVYKYPSGTNDAGTAIADFYVTKQFIFSEQFPFAKELRLLRVFASQKGNYNLDIETRTDFESTGDTTNLSLQGETSVWGTAVFGTDKYGGQNLIIGRVELYKEGDFYQFKFSNDNADEAWEVKGFEMFLEGHEDI